MKYVVFIMIIVIVSCKSSINVQENKSEKSLHFQNQGEQENYWAIEFFEKEYKNYNYPKFQGEVKVNNSEILFGEKEYIKFSNIDQKYILIFKNGLLYPSLLMTDTLDLCCFEELTLLSDNPKIKRFRFVLWNNIIFNPNVYFIELTNQIATKDDSWEVFIENAKLTFLKYGWTDI